MIGWRDLTLRVAGKIAGRVEADASLKALNTYRIGGSAALLFEPRSTADIEIMSAELRASMDPSEVEWLVLGRGSNMVVSDDGWPGVVLRLAEGWSWIRGAGESSLQAGASTPLPQAANWAARRSLSGFEFAVGIPGSIGGAVRMNAGAHEASIADILKSVTVLDLTDLTVDERPARALALAYRHSNLPPSSVVLDATFGLTPDADDAIRARMERYRKHRADTQPGALQNAGSVFKNPPGDSAGRLVEAAGLKGFRVGGAWVSDLHANFFMAADDATSQDVFDLVQEVRARVKERFDIDLEPEIRFVGNFASGKVRGAP